MPQHNRRSSAGPRISYTSRSSPIPISRGTGARRNNAGPPHWSCSIPDQERSPSSTARTLAQGDSFELDLDREPELQEESGYRQGPGGRGRQDSEEVFNGDDGDSGGGYGMEGDDVSDCTVSGRFASSPPRRRAGSGGGRGGGDILFSPAYNSTSFGGDGRDDTGWGWGRGADGDRNSGGQRGWHGNDSSGAICIGGGGGGSGRTGRWLGVESMEELRGDRGSYGYEDLALGKSLDDPFQFNFDSVYRDVDVRTARHTKSKGLGGRGGGGSSVSLTGKYEAGGGNGNGGGAARSERKASSSGFKINSNSGTSNGSSRSLGSGGGVGWGGGGKRGGGTNYCKSASAGGGKKGLSKERLNFDGSAGGGKNRMNRGRQSKLLVRQGSLSQADTASAKKVKTRQRNQEVRRAKKEKEDRFHAESAAVGGGLWETYNTPEGFIDGGSGGGGGGHYGPSSGSFTALNRLLLHGKEGIRCRVKKQSNRPSDSNVQKAQTILAKSLQRGGKSVLLPGLDLRYPQNVRALLEDAAQALQHGLLPAMQSPLAWTSYWAPMQILDLSRNMLEGIDALLVVDVPAGDGGRGGGVVQETAAAAMKSGDGEGGDGDVGQDWAPGIDGGGGVAREEPGMKCGEERTRVHLLAGLQELRLNGNQLHGIPWDLTCALSSLVKLELYGNRIVEIRAPQEPLLRLKHLDLGYNNLLELPAEACAAMPNLERLLLPNNLLEWLPREVICLEHLKHLDVSKNPLATPPVEVAARGLDSVKRYFADIESQASRWDDQSPSSTAAEERGNVEVPNHVKIIFIGHAEAGKSEVVNVLSAGAALNESQDGAPGTDSASTEGSGGNGGGGSSGSRVGGTPAWSTPVRSSGGAAGAAAVASNAGGPHHQERRRGIPPRTPPTAPPPADEDNTPDDEGWRVVGTVKGGGKGSRSSRSSNSTHNSSYLVPSTPPPPNRSRERPGMPLYGVETPAPGAVPVKGRRWETAAQGAGGGSGSRGDQMARATNSLLPPDSQGPVMNIRTVTYTPTMSKKGRKRLAGGSEGGVSAGEGGQGSGGDNNVAAGAATPSLSGRGAGGEGKGGGGGEADITLKLWDFGGTEEFHAVHGLFFSGRALYTVVFDLRYAVERDDIDERVQFWVDFVQSRVPGSLILLVGTHADCMTQAEAEARIKAVRAQLQDNEERVLLSLRHDGADVGHLRNRPQIEELVHAVSCKHHQGFRGFRDQVLKLARDAQRFPPSRLPPTWVEADRLVKLRREEKHQILSVDDLVAGLRRGSDGVGGRETAASGIGGEGHSLGDLRSAVVSTLEWLNDTSEVVYFNKPGLDEFVVLHPVHLMGAIRQIVRRDLKKTLRALIRLHQDREHLALVSGSVCGGLLPASESPCATEYPPLVSSSAPSSLSSGGGVGGGNGQVDPKLQHRRSEAGSGARRGSGVGGEGGAGAWGKGGQDATVAASASAVAMAAVPPMPVLPVGSSSNSGVGGGGSNGKPSYLEKLAAGTGIGGDAATATVGVDAGGVSTSVPGGGGNNWRKAAETGARSSAVAALAAAPVPAPVSRAILTFRDEVRLDSGFVSRAVIDVLLEPLAEFNCGKTGREFLIRLFQESCVLVKATRESSPDIQAGIVQGRATGAGQPQTIIRSQSIGPGNLPLSKPPAAVKPRKEHEIEYFIPCILPTKRIEWVDAWVHNVHCGRRWRFRRFVPPSLMSALISRFYGLGKRGSAILSRQCITIKIAIGEAGGGGGRNGKNGRRRGEAEVFLMLHRGSQKHAYLSMQSPFLELLAQAASRRLEDLMMSLGPLIKEVERTLAEFPGLVVERRVICPACMEKKPGDHAAWGELPLEIVEEKKSCPEDLPRCKDKCSLHEQQKRLMFVGEMHRQGEDDEGFEQTDADSRHHKVWDSPLPELGAPSMLEGGGGLVERHGGFGVPKVDSLYPAVCPIAVYDLKTRSMRAHATAFIVNGDKGHLLTAGHTFMDFKPNTTAGKSGDEGGAGGARGFRQWQYFNGITFANCVVLVGMFEPPYTTRWEFVAEAVQHSALLRSKVYAKIGWNKDHPVLLRIKIRFKPVPTRVESDITFKGITRNWRGCSSGGEGGAAKITGAPTDQQQRRLTALKLGDSRKIHKGNVEHLTIYQEKMLEVLKSDVHSGDDVFMTMAVFPQELLTLVAFPEHNAPHYSSVSVTHGPVSRNLVTQDVIEVSLSNESGASGGPVLSTRGEVVGILSQGNSFSAYVMGISTAKTLLLAPGQDLEAVLSVRPFVQMWQDDYNNHLLRTAADRIAAADAASNAVAASAGNGRGSAQIALP